MNGADITRLVPGWQIADAYDAVWDELTAIWQQPPEPRPSLRLVGQLTGVLAEPEAEEETISLVALQLLGQGPSYLDAELEPILDAFCFKCRARFASGTWPGGIFPDRSTDHDYNETYAVCPTCGEQALSIPSLQEAERRVLEAGRLRAALTKLGMDAGAFTTARDLVRAGFGAEVVALVGRSCVWFGSLRLGLGREEEESTSETDEARLGPALVDRVITEPDVHLGTDAYEGQDPVVY